MTGRTRSRNYPGMCLSEALEKARELYSTEGKAAVPKDVAVKSWGYNGLNGASLRVLGALNQFGLLDSPESRTVRLSPLALAIILEPVDSAERGAAIQHAAQTPAIFREILDQYPDGLPSDAALMSYLVRHENFSESAAKILIASLRDTLEVAKEAAQVNISPDGERKHKQSEPDNQGRQGAPVNPAVQTHTYSLPDVVATLTIKGKPATDEAARLLRDWLDLVKRSLGVDSSASPPPGTQ